MGVSVLNKFFGYLLSFGTEVQNTQTGFALNSETNYEVFQILCQTHKESAVII